MKFSTQVGGGGGPLTRPYCFARFGTYRGDTVDTKLTLKLDEKAIERAKTYASRRGVSLSRMVETYFLSLAVQEERALPQPTGVVAELAGMLAGRDIDLSEEGRARYLARKYS
jgi:hypothetical protein